MQRDRDLFRPVRPAALVLFLTTLIATSPALALDSPDTSEGTAEEAFGDVQATAEAWLEAVPGIDGNSIQLIRYGWSFDRQFSQQMRDSFDNDGDGRLQAAELREASQSVYDTIKMYRYFLLVTHDGRDVTIKPPAQLAARFEDARLSVEFETRPAAPMPISGAIELGIYDPTFSIEYGTPRQLTATGLPAHCSSAIVHPDFDEVLAKNPNAIGSSDQDPDGGRTIRLFATRLAISCKPAAAPTP